MATQKRPLPSVETAKAPTLRTIADIFDANYQAHAFDPPISPGGASYFTQNAGGGFYGPDQNGAARGNWAIDIMVKRDYVFGGYGVASGNYAVLIGTAKNTAFITPQASATGAVAIGVSPYATGVYAVAIGYNAKATQFGATALGSGGPNAIAPYSICIGAAQVNAGSDHAIAIGQSSIANGDYSIALGSGAQVPATGYTNSVAIGHSVQTTASNQVAIGVSNTNKIIFDNWAGAARADAAATHSLSILIGGTRYYILMTTVAP